MVAVHVGQEEEPRPGALPHLPEVDSQRGVRDDFSVGGHALSWLETSRCVTSEITRGDFGEADGCHTFPRSAEPIQKEEDKHRLVS